jgi:hypothetical protein
MRILQQLPRSLGPHHTRRDLRGYLLTEVLVYISVVMMILGVGYIAMYRSIQSSLMLRRGADDIARALSVGELWRADARRANVLRTEETPDGVVIYMDGADRTNAWRHSGMVVMRRVGEGHWVRVFDNAKGFSIVEDPRREVTPWRLELELATRSKAARTRPLFTFIAIPENSPLKK